MKQKYTVVFFWLLSMHFPTYLFGAASSATRPSGMTKEEKELIVICAKTACLKEDIQRAKQLLADGVNPNISYVFGHGGKDLPAIVLAACTGNLPLVSTLLSVGADPNVWYATRYGKRRMALHAAVSMSVENKDPRSFTGNYLAVIHRLCTFGAVVNHKVERSTPHTPLQLLARQRMNPKLKQRAMSILMQYHARINDPNFYRETPLHAVVELGDKSTVEFLLAQGARKRTGTAKNNPYSTACKMKRYDIAALVRQAHTPYHAKRRAQERRQRRLRE